MVGKWTKCSLASCYIEFWCVLGKSRSTNSEYQRFYFLAKLMDNNFPNILRPESSPCLHLMIRRCILKLKIHLNFLRNAIQVQNELNTKNKILRFYWTDWSEILMIYVFCEVVSIILENSMAVGCIVWEKWQEVYPIYRSGVYRKPVFLA